MSSQSARRATLIAALLLVAPAVYFLTPTTSAAVGTPTFTTLADPNGNAYGEPTLGVDPESGQVLYQSGFDTWRVDTATNAWTDVSYPNNVASADPLGYMDPVTGRYFASQLLGECSTMGFTDDEGETWAISQGCGIVNGADHQTVGSGPWADGAEDLVPPPSYERSVYYCIQAVAGATCARSNDGGVTFGPSRLIYTLSQCNGLHGHVRVGPDGTVYVPNKNCGGVPGVAYSRDNGETWAVSKLPAGLGTNDGDPSVWATETRVYVGFVKGNGHPAVAYSTNGMTTWTPVDLAGTHPGGFTINSAGFPSMVAGDNERAAFSFLGSDGTGDEQSAAFPGNWYVYTAFTFDGGATWEVVSSSPGNIIQRGGYCTYTNCGSHRNLLDFMDSVADTTGAVHIAVPDGCTVGCTTSATSRDALNTVVKQTGGKTLRALYDEYETVPSSTVVAGIAGTDKAALVWSPPFDGRSPITAYKIYKGTSPGVLSLHTTLAPGTTYTDASVTNGATYYYAVSAVNAIGEGAASNEVAVTPVVDSVAPDAITGLAVVDAVNNRIELAWNEGTDDNGIVGYRVSRDGSQIAIVDAPATGFADVGVQNGRTHTYAISALDATGNAGAATSIDAMAIRVPNTRIIAADPAGDSAGVGATDLRNFGFLTTDTQIKLEWFVQNMADFPTGGKAVTYRATFTIANLQYVVSYEAGGSRCYAYHGTPAGGVVGIAGTCGKVTPENRAFITFDRAGFEAPFADGDDIVLSAIATSTTSFDPLTGQASSVAADSIAGTFTYEAGTPPAPLPPVFSVADQDGAEGALLAFTASASDPQGDYVTYSSDDLPSGATLDEQTGAFSWTPDFTQAGSHAFSITASNGAASTTDGLTAVIVDVNRAPVIEALDDATAQAGEAFSLSVVASDPDGQAVSLSSTALHAGAAFNTATGAFSWTPTFAQEGDHAITFSASDGALTTDEAIVITVVTADRAPTLVAIADKTMKEGATSSIALASADPDGDALVLSASGLPAWATLTDNGDGTGSIALAPAVGDTGATTITVTATANGLTASDSFVVTVVQNAALTLVRVGGPTVQTAPGETIALSATITNTGTRADTFTFAVTMPASWSAVTPADVTLEPGDSTVVTITATTPNSGAPVTASLTAKSLGDTAVRSTVSWNVKVPVVISVALDQESFTPLESVTGTVTATWLDGSPLGNVAIRLVQGSGLSSSTLSGRTAADGTFAFDFGDDLLSRTPGSHALVVSVFATGATTTKSTSYEIAP